MRILKSALVKGSASFVFIHRETATIRTSAERWCVIGQTRSIVLHTMKSWKSGPLTAPIAELTAGAKGDVVYLGTVKVK